MGKRLTTCIKYNATPLLARKSQPAGPHAKPLAKGHPSAQASNQRVCHILQLVGLRPPAAVIGTRGSASGHGGTPAASGCLKMDISAPGKNLVKHQKLQQIFQELC